MFEALTKRLDAIFDRLRGAGRLSEENIQEALREVRMALRPPTVIMVLGLHGSGKTTTVAKLGRHFQREGFRPLLVGADIYRPAAIEQLRVLGGELGLPVHGVEGRPPVELAREALDQASTNGWNPVLLDTAGRLHIDEAMVAELKLLRREVKPHHVLLVVDAMTGQDAVTMAERFNQEQTRYEGPTGITGVLQDE